eukprot:snap_masked-scaffold_17-processed-gene-6.43-mRNA-1 protein AED:1.00 eAED:1.00 QI:0/-1/0/0/-1/1/1/0/473
MKLFGLSTLVLAYAQGFEHLAKNVRKNFGDDKVITFTHETLKGNPQIAELLLKHEADHFGLDEEKVHYKVSQMTVNRLNEMSTKSFEDSTEDWIEHFENNFRDENFMCRDGAACAKRSAQDFYSSYQPLDAVHARVTDLAEASEFATISSIGSSYEGRDQLTVNIGNSSKPLVFYFCNIHAREWLTPMFCTYMVETLLADGGHPLLDDFSFTILPSANPDGYSYTWTNDNLWRKTRNVNAGSTCRGTDPNRNYPHKHCGPGASTNPCSESYCGRSPLDQIETANIAAFVEKNNERLISVMDVHSFSYMWMYPYGYTTSSLPSNDKKTLNQCTIAAVDAIEKVSGRRWLYGAIAETLYVVSGGSLDWFYVNQNILHSYTVELRGTSFQPRAENIVQSNKEMFAGLDANLNCIAGRGGESGSDEEGDDEDRRCVDSDPTGITVGGVETPCRDLRIYCSGYDFVRETCPFTCRECD